VCSFRYRLGYKEGVHGTEGEGIKKRPRSEPMEEIYEKLPSKEVPCFIVTSGKWNNEKELCFK
jgi:hypothetical protein